MSGKSKGSLLLALVFVLSVFLAACGNAASKTGTNHSGGSSSNKGGSKQLAANQEINLRSSADIPGLDSSTITDTTSFQLLYMIHGGLATVYNNKAVPDLAAKPTVTKNGTVYTFNIRKDAKWSNGDPVTAQDFVFAWRRTVNPKTKSNYAYIYASANIKNAAQIEDSKSPLFGKVDKLGVKALDSKTLQVTLATPTPYFYSLMSFPSFFAQNAKFVQSKGKKYAAEPSDLLYDGPYIMKSWNHGVGWTLKKNSNYWNAKNITIKKVNTKVVKTESTAVKLYASGKINLVKLTSDYVNQYKKSPELQQSLGSCVFDMSLNVKKVKPFQDPNVRRAISMSINRDGLAGTILNDGSIAAHSWVPKKFVQGPAGKDFDVNINKQSVPYVYYNPGKAKKLWNQAKKTDHFSNLKVSMMIVDESNQARIAQFLQNELEKLPGLKVTINKQPWGNYLKLGSGGHFDIAAGSGWCPDYKDPMTFLNQWTKSNNTNDSLVWYNPKYEKLVKQASQLGTQQQKRWKVLEQINTLLMNQLATIPLYQQGTSTLINSNIKGLSLPSYGPGIDYRHAKVYQK